LLNIFLLNQEKLAELGFMILAAQDTLKTLIANGLNEVSDSASDAN
jgi:hypothetical protein